MEQHIGDYGVAVAGIIGAILIVRMLTGLMTTVISAWRDTRREEIAMQQRRNDIEEKQLGALERMSEHLEQMDMRARATTQQTHDLLLSTRREQQQAQGANLQLLGELRQELARVPGLTAEEVQMRITPLFDKAQQQITEAATNLLSANAQIEQVTTLLRVHKDKRGTGPLADQVAPPDAEKQNTADEPAGEG